MWPLDGWLQAGHRTYEAVALLGFAGSGLLSHLTEAERAYVDDPEGVARDLAPLVATRFGAPRSRGGRTGTGSSPFLLAVDVPDNAKAAIGASGSVLLTLCGLTSMIPGASRPALNAVDVPVFIGVGEHCENRANDWHLPVSGKIPQRIAKLADTPDAWKPH